MKTFLLVILSILFVLAFSPESPKAQSQPLPEGGVASLLTSLASTDSLQGAQAQQTVSTRSSQPLLEIQSLAVQRRDKLTRQAGWLHIQTRNVQTDPDPLSPFATGLNQFEQNQWLELNGNGQVHQAIILITDEYGKTLQVSLFEDGSWNNLTVGAQSQVGAAFIFDPNYGFDELAARLVQQGETLNKSLLYKECWYQGEKYSISDGQLTHEAVFNTGYQTLRWIKTWKVTPDGDVSLADSLEVLVEERVPHPPAEVLTFLQQASDLP